MAYHNPVLLNDSVDVLVGDVNGVYVDCTFGGGGHSREIMSRLGESGRLISFDQDQDARANALDDERFTLVMQNFRFLKNNLRYLGYKKINGVLADLGVSSHQFDTPERGFSIRFDGNLDMRMNQSAELTAATIINEYDENRLADVFYYYGELKNARKLAREVVAARRQAPIETVEQLKKIFSYIPKNKETKFL